MDTPSIDVNIPLIEKRMSAFKASLGMYTTMNQEEVMKRRDQHGQELESIREERVRIDQEIQKYRLKEIALAKLLEEERQERKHSEEVVAHSNRQLKSLQEKLAAKEEESKKLDNVLDQLKKSKEKEKRQLDKQASQVAKDVSSLELMLGATIRGAGDDVLRVVFTNLDPKDPEREFSIVIDLSRQEYRVPEVSPPLAALHTLLDGLNASRDLYAFLRRIQRAFATSLEVP